MTKPAAPTIAFAVRTAKGERRRIKSFLKQVEELGVRKEDLPAASLRALDEADRFLGRYLDVLSRETPTPSQLEGVIEALGGIDKVVKNAMAEILKSLGWRPEPREEPAPGTETPSRPRRRMGGDAAGKGAKIIPFPGPRTRRSSF